jgi:integrase
MTIPGKRGRRLPGTYASEAEAEAVRIETLAILAKAGRSAVGGLTLRSFGHVAVARWEARGQRSVYDDRNMFNVHVATAHFADWPIQNIRRADVKRWRDELLTKKAVRAITKGPKGARVVERTVTARPLSRQRIINVLSLIRRIFHEALEDEVIDRNPALEVYAPSEQRTDEPWTFLELDEQRALLAVIPPFDRRFIQFAMGTGMRWGELCALRREDVRVEGENPTVLVRYGSRTKAPKNGRIRTIQLFGLALDAANEQLVALDRLRNVHGLMWPGERGRWRSEGKAPRGWTGWLRAAGIARNVRPHDLRHTCAAALVSGMWGPAWRLEEVRDQLGHSSVKVTERYAHLAGSALKRAAAATIGPRWTTNP